VLRALRTAFSNWSRAASPLVLRLNLGYGIDNAQDSGLFGLKVNSGIFANALWDVNPWLQLGLEGNYKVTTITVDP
jgi:hypothetical protein